MYAVIHTGGKQYRVEAGRAARRRAPRRRRRARSSCAPVLLVDGDSVLATPAQLGGASVTARVVGEAKGPKINGFTYKTKIEQAQALGPPPAATRRSRSPGSRKG